MAEDDALAGLRAQERSDRKLMRRAAEALAEIDRAVGLTDEQADVLTALRIRIEGKKRASLEDLLQSTEGIGGKHDLGDVLGSAGESKERDWPVVDEPKRDWPGL